jgi:hypothetical protein
MKTTEIKARFIVGMRNFRKTRKRGGVSVNTVLECVSPFAGVAKCGDEFVKRENFVVVEVPGDGNCFYHTLAKYYELSRPAGAPPGPTHKELRKIVIDKMEEEFEIVKNGLLINTSNIPKNTSNAEREVLEDRKYRAALQHLRRDGVWASNNADLVSQFAAKALNLTIKIYDRKAAVKAHRRLMSIFENGTREYRDVPAEPAKIICYTFDPEVADGVGTVHMFRVSDSHYKLLYPGVAAVAPPRGRRATAKKANGAAGKPNVVNNTVAKMASMKLTNKKVTNSKKGATTGYATRSKAKATSPSRTPSMERALKNIAAMEAKQAAEEKKKAAAAKRAEAAAAKKATAAKKTTSRNRTSSLENALIKIALQESEQEQKKKKQLNENFFAALEAASFEEK